MAAFVEKNSDFMSEEESTSTSYTQKYQELVFKESHCLKSITQVVNPNLTVCFLSSWFGTRMGKLG